MSLTVFVPPLADQSRCARLEDVLRRALAGREVRTIRRAEELDACRGTRLLIALALDEAGQNGEAFRTLGRLRR